MFYLPPSFLVPGLPLLNDRNSLKAVTNKFVSSGRSGLAVLDTLILHYQVVVGTGPGTALSACSLLRALMLMLMLRNGSQLHAHDGEDDLKFESRPGAKTRELQN